jgi:hypothetical protein
MYIHVYIYIFIQTYMHTHIYICMHIYTHTYTYIYLHTHIHCCHQRKLLTCLSNRLSILSLSGGTGSDQSMACTISPRLTFFRGHGISLMHCKSASDMQSSRGRPPCTQKIWVVCRNCIFSTCVRGYVCTYTCTVCTSVSSDWQV